MLKFFKSKQSRIIFFACIFGIIMIVSILKTFLIPKEEIANIINWTLVLYPCFFIIFTLCGIIQYIIAIRTKNKNMMIKGKETIKWGIIGLIFLIFLYYYYILAIPHPCPGF